MSPETYPELHVLEAQVSPPTPDSSGVGASPGRICFQEVWGWEGQQGEQVCPRPCARGPSPWASAGARPGGALPAGGLQLRGAVGCPWGSGTPPLGCGEGRRDWVDRKRRAAPFWPESAELLRALPLHTAPLAEEGWRACVRVTALDLKPGGLSTPNGALGGQRGLRLSPEDRDVDVGPRGARPPLRPAGGALSLSHSLRPRPGHGAGRPGLRSGGRGAARVRLRPAQDGPPSSRAGRPGDPLVAPEVPSPCRRGRRHSRGAAGDSSAASPRRELCLDPGVGCPATGPEVVAVLQRCGQVCGQELCR